MTKEIKIGIAAPNTQARIQRLRERIRHGRVTAAADTGDARVAATAGHHGITLYDSPEAMIRANEIDALYIVADSIEGVSIAMDAVRSGLAVFCEPTLPFAADASRSVDAAAKTVPEIQYDRIRVCCEPNLEVLDEEIQDWIDDCLSCE